MDWEISYKDLIEVAAKLFDEGDFQKALQVWKSIHRLFPNEPEVYRASALACKRMGDYESADSVLCEGKNVHPDNRTLFCDHAYLAQDQNNWIAALERWESYDTHFPGEAIGYLGISVALRELKRGDEAERILQTALAIYPDNAQLLANRAYVAQQRDDWATALRHWNFFHEKFPDDPIGYSSIGVALMTLLRFREADSILEEGLEHFPDHPQLLGNYAWSAYRAHDWPEALKRWTCYRDKFPTDPHGHFQVLWVLGELGRFEEASVLAGTAVKKDASSAELSQLLLRFESLGDNCEFGVVQRHYGAEPLGLLRFTATPSKLLIIALNSDFAGVGDAENTILRTYNGEYLTGDTRYHMAMHTFIRATGDDRDKRFVNVCRRIRFLRDKLLQDLKDAEKIFVYGCREALTDDDIRELWSALRRYGDNRLLFVAAAGDENVAGTVRQLELTLVVGFVDRLSVDNPSFELWLEVCRQASALMGQRVRKLAESVHT